MYTVEEKIIVKRLKEKDIGSVYIPDSAKEKPIEGIVFSVGPKVSGIKPKDHIMFDPQKVITLEVKGEEFIVVELRDVFIIIGDKDGK